MIIRGDCIEEMKKLNENSVDAIVTDPPYGLEFMGKNWDKFKDKEDSSWNSGTMGDLSKLKNGENYFYKEKGFKTLPIFRGATNKDMQNFQQFTFQWAKECLRVLKPGGYLLSFGGTRTYHRMACGIEDAGFEIRDCIQWLYGSGFPKSLNIAKSIDKIDTIEFRKQVGLVIKEARNKKGFSMDELCDILKLNNEGHGGMVNHYENGRATPTLELWKKICEVLEIKDLQDYEEIKKGRTKVIGKIENPISWFGEGIKEIHTTPEAKEWEGWGTALKPACEPIVVARKPLSEKNVALNVLKHGTGGINIDACRIGTEILGEHKSGNIPNDRGKWGLKEGYVMNERQGRFPSNIILDEEVGKMLDEQSGVTSVKPDKRNNKIINDIYEGGWSRSPSNLNDKGGASRFFYCAKASKSERNFGCEDMEDKEPEHDFGTKLGVKRNERIHTPTKNNHPTVKPIALMEYLIKLVSREGSIVLDHFAGSGTTLIACAKLNRRFIGIEKEEEYIKIAKARLKPYLEQKKLIFNDNSQSKLKEEIQLNTRANPHDAIKSYEDLF